MNDDENLTEVWLYQLPDCDTHLKFEGLVVPAAYDAETIFDDGCWAFMCADCFRRFGTGRGLGTGLGQRLILRATEEEEAASAAAAAAEVKAAAELGRNVGAGMRQAVGGISSKVYRFARRARWVDATALLVLLAVLPCVGLWFPRVTLLFTASFLLDLFMCWKLNPKRSTRGKTA